MCSRTSSIVRRPTAAEGDAPSPRERSRRPPRRRAQSRTGAAHRSRAATRAGPAGRDGHGCRHGHDVVPVAAARGGGRREGHGNCRHGPRRRGRPWRRRDGQRPGLAPAASAPQAAGKCDVDPILFMLLAHDAADDAGGRRHGKRHPPHDPRRRKRGPPVPPVVGRRFAHKVPVVQGADLGDVRHFVGVGRGARLGRGGRRLKLDAQLVTRGVQLVGGVDDDREERGFAGGDAGPVEEDGRVRVDAVEHDLRRRARGHWGRVKRAGEGPGRVRGPAQVALAKAKGGKGVQACGSYCFRFLRFNRPSGLCSAFLNSRQIL